jgi:unsaturated rhamnogalacturonyl hydrolase
MDISPLPLSAGLHPLLAGAVLLFPFSASIALGGDGLPIATARVSNPSDFARADELVTLSLSALGLTPGQAASVVARAGGKELPLQVWDENADGTPDHLTVVLDLGPAEAVELELVSIDGTPPAFPARVQAELSHKFGGQWEGRVYQGGEFRNVETLTPPPEHTDHSFFIRYEGPGWESDKVGYRFYLDWRNGFDIFGKLTPELVLQEVGQDGFDSYHEMADWGMDILKVGSALGIGGFGYWDRQGKAIERVSEVEGWTAAVSGQGPVWAQVRTEYRDWKVAGKTVDLVSRLRIGAGSRITWVDLELPADFGAMATGLVKHPRGERLESPSDVPMVMWTYLATWGPQTLNGDDLLGMAILVRKNQLDAFREDAHNHVAVFKNNRRHLHYGFLAAWEREPDGIRSREEFVTYLERTVERLNRPARVELKVAAHLASLEQPLTADAAAAWTSRLVESVVARRGRSLALGEYNPESGAMARWTYTTGLLAHAVDEAGKRLGRDEWRDWAEDVIGSYVDAEGGVETYRRDTFNVDQLNSGKMLLRLHEKTGEARYRKAADYLHSQFDEHPRTRDGAFWHKQIYPWQVWLDGVYMAGPFHAGYLAAYAPDPDWADVLAEFRTCYDWLRDPRSGLYFHAWDEARAQPWADPRTGLSEEFWGRGLGWYAMALVDVLEILPESAPEHGILKEYLRELAAALVKVQSPENGLWSQVLDQPGGLGNYREASASSMFVYALAKGVNHGWLGDEYRSPARRGYLGILRHFVRAAPDGSLSLDQICEVAGLGFGRDGSYGYYMNEPIVTNDPKGVGPFIFAGLEVADMLR